LASSSLASTLIARNLGDYPSSLRDLEQQLLLSVLLNLMKTTSKAAVAQIRASLLDRSITMAATSTKPMSRD
jgi:hypothetical protein